MGVIMGVIRGVIRGATIDQHDLIMCVQVCRPLKSRVEQILVSEGSPVTLYRLTNLIRYDIRALSVEKYRWRVKKIY